MQREGKGSTPHSGRLDGRTHRLGSCPDGPGFAPVITGDNAQVGAPLSQGECVHSCFPERTGNCTTRLVQNQTKATVQSDLSFWWGGGGFLEIINQSH